MTNLWTSDVTGLIVAAVAAIGLAAITTGVVDVVRGLGRTPYTNATLLLALTGFRRAMIGLMLAGMAGAWHWDALWLLLLTLGLGGEETLESSMMIWALRHHRSHTPARRSRARVGSLQRPFGSQPVTG